MKQTPAALLIALVAISAVVTGQRSTPATIPPKAELDSKTATTASGTSTGEDKETAAIASHWQEPIRLYREFFGIPFEDSVPASEVDGEKALQRIGDEARGQNYALEFMVALVADPVDSNLAANFDQALDGIQLAFADSGYLLDRVWLPWSGDADKNQLRSYRSTPGVLLFRDPGSSSSRRKLAAVFLVGETPKQGIHKRAFQAAVRLIMKLKAAAAQPGGPPAPSPDEADSIRILGPSFSGSEESLRLACNSWGQQTAFRIMTGTATAPGLEEYLGPSFAGRAVESDDVLQDRAYGFFEKLGWDLSKIALLKEFDTSYGKQSDLNSKDAKARLPLQVFFPSGLSDVRTAWEKNAQLQAPNGAKNAITIPQSALEVSLADHSKPVDIVPHFSSVSIDSSDLAISNLLETIWREGIRYVGILSTDPRDKIFLAERIRRFAPDMILFTLDNNLLYSHPQYSDNMDGTLVLGSFPLLTETNKFRDFLGGPYRPFARQFSTEAEEGLYNAARWLLGNPIPQPRTWIAAVGGGSLWPIAALSEQPPPDIEFDKLGNREDLQFLAVIAILCLLAICLGVMYPHLDLFDGAGGIDLTASRLLVFGSAVLCVGGGLVVVLGTLPLWATGRFRPPNWQEGTFQFLYLAGLLGAYCFLVAYSAYLTRPPGPTGNSTARKRRLAWAGVGILLVPALALSLEYLWMPGGAQFFYLRARKLSSGLSPIVPLAFLVSALYVWILLELKRRRSIARQAIEWPLQAHLEPPLVGSKEMAGPLYKALHLSLPDWRSAAGKGKMSAGQKFWLVFVIVIAPPSVRLLQAVQPIGERRLYGQIFLVVALAAFGLCVISLYQFFSLWRALEKLLQRLDNSRLVKAFVRISAEVNWKPMKSFWWQLTTFKMLVLSAERFRQIDARGRYATAGLMEGIDTQLQAMFEADRTGDIGAETAARTSLNDAFSAAGNALASDGGDPKIEEFFAVRVVSYLRPFIGHMRNCITASLSAGLLLLFAVRNYAFEPKWFISAMIWSFLTLAIIVTLWFFVQIDKNASLSAIGGTEPGKVTFDRHFVTNILVYGALPLIGVVLTQFPGAGKFFAGWFNPLLRIVGVQ